MASTTTAAGTTKAMTLWLVIPLDVCGCPLNVTTYLRIPSGGWRSCARLVACVATMTGLPMKHLQDATVACSFARGAEPMPCDGHTLDRINAGVPRGTTLPHVFIQHATPMAHGAWRTHASDLAARLRHRVAVVRWLARSHVRPYPRPS